MLFWKIHIIFDPSTTKNLKFMQNSTVSEIIPTIQPFLPAFKRCYKRALEKLNLMLAANPGELFIRAKATLLHNLMVLEIKSEFFENPDVEMNDEYESLILVILKKFSLRFKKLNKQGVPSNHKSGRNDKWISQQLSFDHPDFTPAPDSNSNVFLDICYAIDETWSYFISIQVKQHDTTLYVYSLDDDADAGTIVSMTDPVAPIAPTTRVKIRKEGTNNE